MENTLLLNVITKLLSSEVVNGAETALNSYLPNVSFPGLIFVMNSNIWKRLLPRLIQTAQANQLPAFELETSLLLENIYRYEGTNEGLVLLQQLESKYPSDALSAEIAVRTFLTTKKNSRTHSNWSTIFGESYD